MSIRLDWVLPTIVEDVFDEDMVGTCPGVELGAWYKFPPLPGPTPSPTPPPTPPPTSSSTISEIVDDDSDLETLYAALVAAGLVDTLNGDGPFTLFGKYCFSDI